MAAYAWNASTGGDWNTAADWTPNVVPTAADTVDFATGGNAYTVTGNGTAFELIVAADQVTFEGTVTAFNEAHGEGVPGGGDGSVPGFAAMEDASVILGATADFLVSSLAFDPGTLLQVAGLLVDDGGGTADTIVDSGLDANVATARAITLNQLYVNQGATFAGDLNLNDGGSVTLDTSAVFGGGTLTLFGSGTLYAANAAGQAVGALGMNEAVQVATGLTLASDPGVTLDMSGVISGAGFVDVNAGAVSLAGPNTYAGGTLVDAATLFLTGAAAAGTGAVFLTDAELVTLADSAGGAGNDTVVAGGMNDTVFAGAGDLTVYNASAHGLYFSGGTGSSTVVGGAGPMYAVGGAGGGAFFAGSGGQDTLVGGSGAMDLFSSAGGTLFAVGTAQDILVASGGNTTLSGAYSSGDDIYFTSGSGATIVQAGGGPSTVVAGGGLNAIYATAGLETVFLTGGASQLDFASGNNSGGTMKVVGFGAADTLHFSGYTADEAQSVLASATVSGGNTILQLSDNEHVVLFGVTDLSASSFV